MNLLEYIKISYLRPNKQILKGLGASDDLITYLMETPRNTNIVIANQLIGSSNETDEGLVIIDGTPVAMYQSGGDYTSIGFLFESEPTTLANIEVGTTFTVEINNQSYDFTIAVVNTESGNRNYASSQSATAPSFSLSDTIEGFACQMAIEGDIRPITHFKVIQTSDYEPVEQPALMTSITVTPPIKTVYNVGDTLDLTGMVVTGNLDNGETITITEDCSVTTNTGGSTLTTSDVKVIVRYFELTDQFTITVNSL